MSLTIKNLVFEGGGVLGIAYAGAIEVLETNQILQQIERVAGTSAGAITATLVTLGFTSAEITKIVQSTNFKSFEDGWDPLRIATKYGLYEGDAFLSWLQNLLKQKGFATTATFADFNSKGLPDLHVFATDLNAKGVKEFSFETTPTAIVAEAVRASMSIPLFFKAWKFSNTIPDNHVYVDGGTVFNYPITVFDQGEEPNPETLGFHFDNLSGTTPPTNLGYDEIYQYTKDLFDTLLQAQVIDFDNNPDEEDRTVRIDDFGISATDFGLTDDQKNQLYNSGKKYTAQFLQQHTEIVRSPATAKA
jgi:NTE family protein